MSGKGATPKEAKETNRSKQLVKIVEIISEGEVQGLVDGAKSIYLDNTPVQNADGSHNFNNLEWQSRHGTQSQEVLHGFTSTEKEISVSTELKRRTALTRTVTDRKVTRLRLTLGVSSLFKQEDNGDISPTRVDFRIIIGSKVQDLSIDGKHQSQYLKNLIITNLPPAPFMVRIERQTEDSNSQRLQNKTLWASYTEIIDHQFVYPNTALIGVKLDSEYFYNIPTRTYDMLGIKVKVPSNYNPQTRQYNGLWDGSFKTEWTDNPAWILYDIVTNKRYGLGQRLGDFGADKWTLYQVAQYCDQLVPDGFGNREPRFTCNVWLSEQRSAYDVINDLCSIFRAIPVWTGTNLTVIQDRPSDPVWTYTNANVIGGFSRQYTAMKARHNAIQVEYKDKDNNYETSIEYISDDEAIRKYGLNLQKVQAFGCTSRGQAYRTGRWILETERLETEMITFSVGAEGLMHLPGDIIKVADSHYAGTEIGGRVLAIQGRNITLDREIKPNGSSYFSYINANGTHSNIRISSVRGTVVTLDSDPVGLETLGVWSMTTQKISARLYRAMTVTENDDGSYTITALQHEPQKEAIVDNGATFEPRNTTLHQLPKISHLDISAIGGNLYVSWQTGSGSGVVTYDIKIIKDGKLYEIRKGLTTTEFDLSDLPDGSYQIIITSRNASGQIIDEKRKTFVIDRPPVPKGVSVQGGLTDVIISWELVDEFTQTEIWASEKDDIKTARRVAKVTANIYTHTIGSRQVRYYWVRHARGQNDGLWYQQQGLKGETGADIDQELAVLFEKLREPIATSVLETALPARNLELILSVPNLDNPRKKLGSNAVYNQADGRLYSWDGKQYSAKLPASSIEGSILPEQLASIPTAKLTGQLTDAHLTSISAAKIQGVLGVSQIPSVPTSKLTGQVSAAQIAANAIGANHLTAGAVTAASIAAGSIKTDHLAANAVSAAKLQANSIGANHIQAQAIDAGKIAANAIQAAHMSAGAIRAEHLAAGQISADKLAIGLGGNLLYNPIFSNNADGWHRYEDNTIATANSGVEINSAKGMYQGNEYLPAENQYKWSPAIKAQSKSTRVGGIYQDVNVVKGQWYILSGFIAAHRGVVGVNIETLGGLSISNVSRNYTEYGLAATYIGGLADTRRIWVKFKATSNGIARCIFNQFVDPNQTSVMTVLRRPMLQECYEHTTEPNSWQNAGVTSINGGSIRTRSITAEQIAANSITGNEIVAGTIATHHLSAHTITGDKIAAGVSLSAPEINAGTIRGARMQATNIDGSWINGTTIAGSTITGNTIRGGVIEGTTINGTNINGGVIRGAVIEGITVKAENIIGDVMRAYSVTYSGPPQSHQATLHLTIDASTRGRLAYLMPVLMVSTGRWNFVDRGNDKGELKWFSESSATIVVKLNDREVLRHATKEDQYTTALQGSIYIPAHTTAYIKVEITKHGNGLADGTQFVFFVGNA